MALLTNLKGKISKPQAVVRLNLVILHWMGFWPKSESCGYTFYTVCFYLVMIASITLSMVAGLVVTLYHGQFQAFLENVCITLTTLSIAIKLLMLWQRRHKVADTLEKLDRYVGRNSEHHLILGAVQDGYYISCVHICFCIINITVHGFATMLEDGNILPFPAYYPIDYDENYLAFVLLYVYQFVTVMSTGILIGDMDTFPVGIMRVICGQIDVIREELRTIGHKTDLLEDEEATEENVVKRLKECIDKYQEMVELSSDVEEIFASMILMQALLSIVVLCVSVFQRTFVSR
jgi:7tm Odorant receptor